VLSESESIPPSAAAWTHNRFVVRLTLKNMKQSADQFETRYSVVYITVSQSQGQAATDGQSVLVSSPLWDARPDFSFKWWPLRSLSSWGALSDERVGLSFVESLSLCHICTFIQKYLHHYIQQACILWNICTVCTRPLSVQALWSRSCLILLSLCCDDS
jgi:hypothetical protein